MVVSIVIVRFHKKKGFGAHFQCPISALRAHISSVLFVDDTDLLHLNMIEEETVEIVHEKSQEAIFNWGQLLIASGGAFKPVKCFFYLISFAWKNSGTWK